MTGGRAQAHTDCGESDPRREASHLARLAGEVDSQSRSVDHESDCRRRSNHRLLRKIEAEQRGRSNAALIADQASEESRRQTRNPARRP